MKKTILYYITAIVLLPMVAFSQILLEENFDDAPAGAMVDVIDHETGEPLSPGEFLTLVPEGWTITAQLRPEEDGYNDMFPYPSWIALFDFEWDTLGGDRENNPEGFFDGIMIADSDLFGNLGARTWLDSPIVDAGDSVAVVVEFDSHYKHNDNQIASMEVTWDGGSTYEPIFIWDDANYNDDGNYVGHETFAIMKPEGATTIGLRFRLYGNESQDGFHDFDWYWAFDNLVVRAADIAPPDTPTLEITMVEPGVYSDVLLTASQFNNPLDSTHAKTVWEAALDPEFTKIFFHPGELETDLTQITIPKEILPIGSTVKIYARVQYIDSDGARSEFSEVASKTLPGMLSGLQVIFNEDFDDLTLEPFPSESGGDGTDWTTTPPEGWTIDNSELPAGGQPEWQGWAFADKEAWISAAGDQERSLFINGIGVVAVVDPDEWDDTDHDAGTYNSYLSTPPISLAGYDTETITLAFNSSWRDEDDQKVNLTASFDGGEPIELLYWVSSPEDDPNFHNDSHNESLIFTIPVPDGASEVTFTWGMFDAGNDWWWAIDNIHVAVEGAEGNPPLPYNENFDGKNDEDLVFEGWVFEDSATAEETGTLWTTVTDRANPPSADGSPTTGEFLISDSDGGDGSNTPGGGGSHDAITPSFSTVGSSEVWLHMNVSAVLNNNGEAIFDVDVSTDGGATFVNQYRCISPLRSVEPLPQAGFTDQQQTGGLYGPVDILLPDAADSSDVKVRFRHYEPNDDWWVAIDDIAVDDVSPTAGLSLILTEGFEGGIPGDWENTPSGTQAWANQPLESRMVDSVISGNGPSDFDGRTLNNLAGQGYAIWVEGEEEGASATLTSPSFDCSACGRVVVGVDSECLPGNGSSAYSIEVSVDGGASFTPIFSYLMALNDLEEDAQFNHYLLDVPQAAGQSNVKIRFNAVGADPGENEGFWAIDNFSLYADGTVPVVDWFLYE
ncbi:MAG: hypothetical protein ACP5I1_00670 [Candidatus Hinthialibacter sp.]